MVKSLNPFGKLQNSLLNPTLTIDIFRIVVDVGVAAVVCLRTIFYFPISWRFAVVKKSS